MTRSLDELSLADLVADSLAQQGVRAVVMEKDSGLEMSTRDARPIWIDATGDLQQWSMLPVNIRQRKANLLAMRFLHIQRGGDANDASKSAQSSITLPAWAVPFVQKVKDLAASPRVKIGAAVLLAGGVIAAIIVLNHKEPPPPPPPDPASETAGQRTARLERACDAARTMMWRGGAWSSVPLEGWTVELWLSRQDGDPISNHPAIETLVNGGKVHWGEKSVFATIADGKADVVAGSAIAPRSDVNIIFSDGYARPFFDIDRRHEFIAIGEQIVKSTNADWGALYAHCAHLTARDVGAWFYGRDPGKAAAALLHTMGKLVGSKSNDFAPYNPAFPVLTTATSKFDEPAFFGVVYQDGARTTNREGIFVTFPFGNPTNASRASKRLAGEIGL